MTNKARRLFLLVAGLLAGQCISVASATPILSIVPETQTVRTHQVTSFSVGVQISDVTDLFAFQFDVSFGNWSVDAVSITEASFLADGGASIFIPGIIDNEAKTISYTAGTLIGAVSGVTGSGRLATITFQPYPELIGKETVPIDLSNVVLLDSNLNDIPISTINGEVLLIPEPNTLFLLFTGLAGVFLRDARARTRSCQLSHFPSGPWPALQPAKLAFGPHNNSTMRQSRPFRGRNNSSVWYFLVALFISIPSIGLAADPIKIMPLGDSLTHGWLDTSIERLKSEGYRGRLGELLHQTGLQFTYVGSEMLPAVSAAADNQGDAVVYLEDVETVAARTGHTYRLGFKLDLNTADTVYDVFDVTAGVSLSTDNAFTSNDIEVDNTFTIRIKGTPAAGDVFTVGPGLAHEGHPGYRIATIAALKCGSPGDADYGFRCKNSRTGDAPWEVEALKPDVILLMIGTNENLSTPDRITNAIDGLKTLIEDIKATPNLSVELFVASIPYKRTASSTTNEHIADYNRQIEELTKKLQENDPQLHFVNINATLTVEDIGSDTLHPIDVTSYEKMADGRSCQNCGWLTAIQGVFQGSRFWVNGSGTWTDDFHWSRFDGGAGGDGPPVLGTRTYLTQTGDIDTTVTYASVPGPVLSRLTVDATGLGAMKLEQPEGDLRTIFAVIGDRGRGQIEHSGGNTTVASAMTLGHQTGSHGSYTLHGPSATLTAINEHIGWSGTGTFVQVGGSNNIYRQLLVGWPAGTGTYTLQDGALSANQEYIGSRRGTATFIQTGGTNSIEAKSPTAGGVEGTLRIATEEDETNPGGPYTYNGTYDMQGGELSAIGIVNAGLFHFSGGSVTVSDIFTNNGVLQVDGQRTLTGNYVQNGQLLLDIVPGDVDRLDVTGEATLNGYVNIQLNSGVSPKLGDSYDILTAQKANGFRVGLFRLPLLPGVELFRPSLVEGGTKIRLSIVSADLDDSGTIDCDDLIIVKSAFGKRHGQPGFNAVADINGDGIVDVRDLAIVTQKLPTGTRCL